MNQRAAVFDFLDARLPFTTRYLPRKFQKSLYPLPTTEGRLIRIASFVICHHPVPSTVALHAPVCVCKPPCQVAAVAPAFRNRVEGPVPINQFILHTSLWRSVFQPFFPPLALLSAPTQIILQVDLPPPKIPGGSYQSPPCHSKSRTASQSVQQLLSVLWLPHQYP